MTICSAQPCSGPCCLHLMRMGFAAALLVAWRAVWPEWVLPVDWTESVMWVAVSIALAGCLADGSSTRCLLASAFAAASNRTSSHHESITRSNSILLLCNKWPESIMWVAVSMALAAFAAATRKHVSLELAGCLVMVVQHTACLFPSLLQQPASASMWTARRGKSR